MSYTVRIESALAVSADDMIAALLARGVDGTVLETDPCLSMAVPVDDEAKLASSVGHALESLIADHRLPLIAERVGESAFVLRPHSG